VALAKVDLEFEPWVSKLGVWYLGNTTQLSPPKTVVRLNRLSASGGFYQVNILLNRWVWLLSMSDLELRNEYLQDLGLLWAEMSKIQKIRWLGGGPLDCRLVNLNGQLSDRASVKRLVKGQALSSDPMRLYNEVQRADPFGELSGQLHHAAPEVLQQVVNPPVALAVNPRQVAIEEARMIAKRGSGEADRLLDGIFNDKRKDTSPVVESIHDLAEGQHWLKFGQVDAIEES
jgi:hypothetical protein